MHSAVFIMHISVILLAGGQGSRMKSKTPKQFLSLHGKLIALYSFELFCSFKDIFEIIVVCEPHFQHLFSTPAFPHVHFALPGDRRQDSVYQGLQHVSLQSTLVCVHDSARPLLSKEDLQTLVEAAKTHHAAALAVPVKCTIKQSDSRGFVSTTLDRSTLWEMHTPQMATPALLKQGFVLAQNKNLTVTDDVSLVELTGHPVKLVQGSYNNLKITTPDDLALAEKLLGHERGYLS
jgi:2-C-methyl-D-erythritol 4-phosphate cytidylyltransferase